MIRKVEYREKQRQNVHRMNDEGIANKALDYKAKLRSSGRSKTRWKDV